MLFFAKRESKALLSLRLGLSLPCLASVIFCYLSDIAQMGAFFNGNMLFYYCSSA